MEGKLPVILEWLVEVHSIVYDCLKYIKASFFSKTQEKYDIFLDYIMHTMI